MYGRFAEVYDRLMEDVPYEQYAAWVASSVSSGKLLDLACGTGTLSELFAELGFDVTASDLSEDMLTVAAERFAAGGHHIPVLCLSMTNLEGLAGFDAVTIAIDSLNYLSSEEEVRQTFREAHKALNPGGHLFFDVHSEHKMTEIFLDGPFVFDDEDITYIWHTEPGRQPLSVVHDLTFFVRSGSLYERFEETHEQRSYPAADYIRWLEEAGFRVEAVTADFTGQEPSPESERIFFHAIK